MSEDKIFHLEDSTGCMTIQGGAAGLYYAKDHGDPRIAIAAKGVVILTLAQARAVAAELADVIDTHFRKGAI